MKDWRILITGATSIHGWPVYEAMRDLIPPSNLYAIRPPKMTLPQGPNVASVCITDQDRLLKIKKRFDPTHVLHCAGVCDLDVCEERPQWARDLNAGGAKNMAEIFGQDAFLMFLSSDLVFSGKDPIKGGYVEDMPPDPVSIAGRTMLEAEEQIQRGKKNLVVRLGLPLGDSITGTKGAVDWIECRFKKGLKVTLFYDEIRSCISCDRIKEIIPKLLGLEQTGLLHFGGDKPVTLHGIGEMVLKKGPYPQGLLKGVFRREEKNGPPRMGDVSLNSGRLKEILRTRLNYPDPKL